MVKTEYAPIVIVTLNRYDHLERLNLWMSN